MLLSHVYSWLLLLACCGDAYNVSGRGCRGAECDAYNVSGRWCRGAEWEQKRAALWVIARGLGRDVGQLPDDRAALVDARRVAASPELVDVWLCPEAFASWQLLHYADASLGNGNRTAVLGVFDEFAYHFRPPVTLWRMRAGGWPDFGAGGFLETDIYRLHFPEVADLVMDTMPRFAVVTPSAPWTIQQGWWSSSNEASHEGRAGDSADLDTESSLDSGMRMILRHTPMLFKRRGLLLVDVGAFDGNSLSSIGLQVDMDHKVLAFEPVASNRKAMLGYFADSGLLDRLLLADPDHLNCIRSLGTGHYLDAPCECSKDASCTVLARVGLAAANHTTQLLAAGAHTSITMMTHGGEVYGARFKESADFRVGEPILRWWVHSVLGLPCLDIHLLKIDVDGAEFSALRGLEPLFAEHRIRFLFLEFWPLAIMTWGTDPLGVLRWLAHYGFHCRFLDTHWGPESFEEFVARHTTDYQMSDFGTDSMSFNNVLCEDLHWHDPCGWERASNEAGVRHAGPQATHLART